jgi:hypothetical protein
MPPGSGSIHCAMSPARRRVLYARRKEFTRLVRHFLPLADHEASVTGTMEASTTRGG